MSKQKNTAAQPSCADAAIEWREEWVPEASIIRHEPLQVRHKLDAGAVKRYRDMTAAGQVPPPIKVGRLPDGSLYLVDGWHRLEAGAVERLSSYEANGDEVRALVADLTMSELRWQAASANLAHGVPLKTREYRGVFRAFIRAGKHKKTGRELMSYREIGAALGIGHTTIRQWMLRDFRELASRMGGQEHGNANAEQPPCEGLSLADEHFIEANKATAGLMQALPQVTPAHRHRIVERLRALVAEAERLGTEEAEPEPF
ncbi:ParB N-terminal domain-containing protein [Rubrivivax gelatinosus]|uniref:Uncharacterized protein n=1 Tax=Rubrivivax gelatinosus (strain NBRC 100245 / IL144) TaxID=983917 RepID=I0HT34_RUBGI|nr:ParB N-terminal domain-containing protein [Rubrivivax gelatinosus]BAL96171.1 hypothetical protein RGE_28320 [Rubrivivax gelatinosus IL144]